MARVTIKGPPSPDIKKMLEGIKVQVRPHMEKQLSERNAVTARWKDSFRPEFRIREIVSGNSLAVFIALKNPTKKNPWGYTIKQVWDWYDKTGQGPHYIPNRLKKAIAFTMKRNSLPSPIGRARNFGAGDALVLRNSYHPGTEAAGTGQRITEDYRAETIRVFDQALKEQGGKALSGRVRP